MYTTAAIFLGFLLDLLFGDPRWMPHPVVWMGRYISFFDQNIRPLFPKTKRGERVGGCFLTISMMVLSFGLSFGILWILRKYLPVAAFLLETFWCYQIFAVKGLKDASMEVYRALKSENLHQARQAVSMIVGRDTESLSEEGVTKAAVETVAENFSDGVIAPLFYLLLGGAPLGLWYKSINTMDSMVGYCNDRYRYFGTVSAKMDDLVNFIPARLAALLLLLAAACLRMPVSRAYQIFIRDRYHHKSPNSAQTESVCAGALGVELAGNAYYFGKLVEKPTIGDALRAIEPEDIRRVNRMLYVASFCGVTIGLLVRLIIELL